MEIDRDAEVESAISQALDENGVDAIYDGVVRRYLHREDDEWRTCCGSCCDPCNLTLARVVDRARDLLR